MNVLLVDDEALVLEELQESVSALLPDANVYSYRRSREAIEFALTTPIDIAFLDVRMRVMDGVTVAGLLQQLYPRVNIVFCTGYPEYALEALNLYCSGYLLKPITEAKLKEVLAHLRYPLSELDTQPLFSFRCFGNFEAYHKGVPIRFEYTRTKELLAYLVDRNGVDCTTRDIAAVLFPEEEHRSYFNRLRRDLISTLTKLGGEDILRQSKGILGINRQNVSCDYFDYMDKHHSSYPGEYMAQYSFGHPASQSSPA